VSVLVVVENGVTLGVSPLAVCFGELCSLAVVYRNLRGVLAVAARGIDIVARKLALGSHLVKLDLLVLRQLTLDGLLLLRTSLHRVGERHRVHRVV